MATYVSTKRILKRLDNQSWFCAFRKVDPSTEPEDFRKLRLKLVLLPRDRSSAVKRTHPVFCGGFK